MKFADAQATSAVPPASPNKTRLDRLDFVDALRGWAVLCVMTVHATMWVSADLPDRFHRFVSNGARGVQLFYVMSAFTLFLSVARRSSVEKKPLRNFFLRRFFRIAPMFYVALTFSLIHKFAVTHTFGGVTFPQLAATVLFLNGWHPHWINSIVTGQWSVAIEMMFYLALPLLAKVVRDSVQALWLFLITLVSSVAIYSVMASWAPAENSEEWFNFIFYWLPAQTPVFALGIVLYFQWLKIETGEMNPRMGRWFLWSGLLLTAIATQGGYRFLPMHVVFSIAFVLFALGLAMKPNRFFVNPAIRAIGNVSYSFYLTHAPVMRVMTAILNRVYRATHTEPPALAQYAALWIFGGLATFAVSLLCFRFVEKPGMDLGKRIIKNLESQ